MQEVKIVKQFGSWAVTSEGLDHVNQPTYEIDSDRLLEIDWLQHMSAKRWVDMDDFTKAFNFALDYHCNQKRVA